MKLALIGGPKAAAHYITAAARFPDVSFSAVVADGRVAADAAAALLESPATGESVAELFDQGTDVCDAVVIHQDAEPAHKSAHAAVAAGKHVLAGAPLATSAEAAGGLRDAAADAGVVLMAGHSWRFRPSLAEIKSSLDAGSLGKPGLLRIHAWRSLELTSGQIALGEATDALDLAVWLFGTSPETIYAIGRAGYLQIHCGFADDGMALIDCANAPAAGGDYLSVSLIGASGAAYADDHHNRNLLFTDGAPRGVAPGEESAAYLAQLQELIAAVGERRPPSVTGDDGVRALQLAEAASVSVQQRQAVRRSGDTYEPA